MYSKTVAERKTTIKSHRLSLTTQFRRMIYTEIASHTCACPKEQKVMNLFLFFFFLANCRVFFSIEIKILNRLKLQTKKKKNRKFDSEIKSKNSG